MLSSALVSQIKYIKPPNWTSQKQPVLAIGLTDFVSWAHELPLESSAKVTRSKTRSTRNALNPTV